MAVTAVGRSATSVCHGLEMGGIGERGLFLSQTPHMQRLKLQ